MPKYKFTWDAFDETTVRMLAEACGYASRETSDSPKTWLTKKVKRPNEPLIRAILPVLLDTPWLKGYAGLKPIVEELIERGIGPMGNPKSQSAYRAYLKKCRNSSTIRRILCEEMIHFGNTGGENGAATGWVPSFALLVPASQTEDLRKPHLYQQEAWDRLSARLAESKASGTFQGLLVMPTGSGKTFTAVRWLIENIINRKGRVLWVAHRHELLEQAAVAFDQAAYLAEPKDRRLRRRIVSGRHGSTTQISPEDDILICSIASLARRTDIVEQVLHSHFLVIDEAHHAPAKSYRDLIHLLKGRHGHKGLLGLTATPTRTIENERPELTRLFGQELIHEVHVRELIEKEFLAEPIPVRVQTNVDAEDGLNKDDIEHMSRFRELSEEWQDRIAKMEQRNAIIIEHLIQNGEKYGKTLIFAVNVQHAHLLVDAFRERGIEAGCITSYQYGDSVEAETHKELLQRFRDPQSGLDVLVNVMILTEGYDAPGIQTVFLTRPTQSEILLRQMVGRALRGPKAGGTAKAYLVSFEDHWERFRELESPFERLHDLMPPPPSVTVDPLPPTIIEIPDIPYTLISAAAAEIRRVGKSQPMDVFEAVPHGWFVLERAIRADDEEQDAVRELIHVYDHQKTCWDALLEHLESGNGESSSEESDEVLFAEYFGDCDVPLPSKRDITRMLEHYRSGGEKPPYHELVDRKQFDPYHVAVRIREEKLDKFAVVEDCYRSALVKAIYPSHRDYVAAVNQAEYDLQYPHEATRVRPGIPIFEPRPEDQLTPPPGSDPAHQLDLLMQEVLVQGRKLLNLPELPFEGKIEWTRRLIKGWYGYAYWQPLDQPGSGRIRVNKLLNSPDVSADTIQFLLWHEYLHLYLQQGHTKVFRELEARWPTRIVADRELDTLCERFGVSYW